jgi:hypothetical protein
LTGMPPIVAMRNERPNIHGAYPSARERCATVSW